MILSTENENIGYYLLSIEDTGHFSKDIICINFL